MNAPSIVIDDKYQGMKSPEQLRIVEEVRGQGSSLSNGIVGGILEE